MHKVHSFARSVPRFGSEYPAAQAKRSISIMSCAVMPKIKTSFLEVVVLFHTLYCL